jgi:hypothetical protein
MTNEERLIEAVREFLDSEPMIADSYLSPLREPLAAIDAGTCTATATGGRPGWARQHTCNKAAHPDEPTHMDPYYGSWTTR